MKMNSEEGLQENGVDQSESPSCSNITDENSNANITSSDGNTSSGAIPKTTFGYSMKKKNIKVNNNLEDTESVNGTSLSSDTKFNGFSLEYFNKFEDVSRTFEAATKVEASKHTLECDLDLKLNSSQNGGFGGDLLFSPLREESYLYQDTMKSDTDSSSSDDNDVLSVSDDGCIYTYKGDNDDGADLPSSFFNLELPPLEPDNVDQNIRNNASSPEMDFLEMDFDPGPSGDADSDTHSNPDVVTSTITPGPSKNDCDQKVKSSCSNSLPESVSCSNKLPKQSVDMICRKFIEPAINNECLKVTTARKTVQNEIKMPWSCSLSERTKCSDRLRRFKKHHNPRGDLVSPSEYNLVTYNQNKRSSGTTDPVMIWYLEEVCSKQINQIGPSSCGATAVLNVLNALRLPIPPIETIQEYVSTQMRANAAPLTEYLLSRSMAGCSHRDIMLGLYNASKGRVYSRFFAMYPERVVNLQKWLGYWIKNGAVPVATLNLQRCDGIVPDSWHHQMVFGVDENSIYLTNPIESVEASQLWPQLSSESVLLIRREDIISRFDPKCDIDDLMNIDDARWKDLNVVGQVAHIIRESRRQPKLGFLNTQFVKIPAVYKSGITLAIDINAPAFKLLHQCPELPLLDADDAATALYK